MANSQGVRFALAAVAVLAVAGCGATKTVTVTSTVTTVRTVTTTPATTSTSTTTKTTAATQCAASGLQGSFAGVQGSAGAGQITYRLTLTNTGPTPCYVMGIPQVQLLGTTGAALPTSSSAEPGQPAPQKVALQHGGTATADARFSPDVNGQGDSQTGRCQPTATVLRVTAPGGGTLDAPVQPPTPVCEMGSLHWRPFVAG
ncbi:MAG TPA: DUF4232 domain-containing protein [Gaiellaceae bacterium]|nr:DUF4232 domain-containing protein [Gaiellaceae bacterium]